MDVKNLPGAGHGFRVSSGAGNFTKKFSSAVRCGDLRNLADNKTSILKAIKAREGDIRVGKFNRLRQRSVYGHIKKLEGDKLTKEDKREIKLILKHLGGVNKEKEVSRKEVFGEEKKEAIEAKPVVPSKVRINRDPNSQYNFNEFRANVRAGVGDKKLRPTQILSKPINSTGLVKPVNNNPFNSLNNLR